MRRGGGWSEEVPAARELCRRARANRSPPTRNGDRNLALRDMPARRGGSDRADTTQAPRSPASERGSQSYSEAPRGKSAGRSREPENAQKKYTADRGGVGWKDSLGGKGIAPKAAVLASPRASRISAAEIKRRAKRYWRGPAPATKPTQGVARRGTHTGRPRGNKRGRKAPRDRRPPAKIMRGHPREHSRPPAPAGGNTRGGENGTKP